MRQLFTVIKAGERCCSKDSWIKKSLGLSEVSKTLQLRMMRRALRFITDTCYHISYHTGAKKHIVIAVIVVNVILQTQKEISALGKQMNRKWMPKLVCLIKTNNLNIFACRQR